MVSHFIQTKINPIFSMKIYFIFFFKAFNKLLIVSKDFLLGERIFFSSKEQVQYITLSLQLRSLVFDHRQQTHNFCSKQRT